MKTLKIDLENCYGIRKLQKEFDFADQKVFAIYAPNGVMKTSAGFKKVIVQTDR